MFERLCNYNTQRTNELLDHAGQLTDEQLNAPQENGHESLAQTLTHMLQTEWSWSYGVREHGYPTDNWPPFNEFPGIDALRERHEQETALFKEYLSSLSDADFDERFEIGGPGGNSYPFITWEVLMHRLLHSAQHRSEIAWMLTGFGHSPGDTDYLFYFWEHPLDA